MSFIEAGMSFNEKTCPWLKSWFFVPELNKNKMKTRIIMLSLLMIFFLQGCLVKSLHPYFTERISYLKKNLQATGLIKIPQNGRSAAHADNSAI